MAFYGSIKPLLILGSCCILQSCLVPARRLNYSCSFQLAMLIVFWKEQQAGLFVFHEGRGKCYGQECGYPEGYYLKGPPGVKWGRRPHGGQGDCWTNISSHGKGTMDFNMFPLKMYLHVCAHVYACALLFPLWFSVSNLLKLWNMRLKYCFYRALSNLQYTFRYHLILMLSPPIIAYAADIAILPYLCHGVSQKSGIAKCCVASKWLPWKATRSFGSQETATFMTALFSWLLSVE